MSESTTMEKSLGVAAGTVTFSEFCKTVLTDMLKGGFSTATTSHDLDVKHGEKTATIRLNFTIEAEVLTDARN